MNIQSLVVSRKQFLLGAASAIGAALIAACSSDSSPGKGGTGGSSGAGGAGAGGQGQGGAGVGGKGVAATGGVSSGAGGNVAKATGGASSSGAMCSGLVTTMELTNTAHIHSLGITAGEINSGNPTLFTTGSAGTPPHTHTVTLAAADLTTLRAGSSVTITSSLSAGHTHDFSIVCGG